MRVAQGRWIWTDAVSLFRRDRDRRHAPTQGKDEAEGARPQTFVAGFSLIEALAALALTAAIVTSLSFLTGQWLPNWSRGFLDLQRADLLAIGLERLVEDVSMAEYVSPSADAPSPLFEGDASSMTFVRSAIGPDSYPHLEVVRIAEAKDDRGLVLARTRAPFAPQPQGRAASSFAFGAPVALIRAPFRVSFAYAGTDRVWVASWKGQERLPDAVRITVRDEANPRLAVSTAVRLKVAAPGVPKLEAQAAFCSRQRAAPPVPATNRPP
jgi:general secretion pathway protein J